MSDFRVRMYADSLRRYTSYRTFGLQISAENTGIMGLSMGGFGAIHTALAYPDRFGKIGAMSSALIVHEVAGILARKAKMPEIYMCCGTEDGLLETNRVFDRFLTSRGVDHIYLETKGFHDMDFWNEYTLKIIPWMFG